MASKLEQSIVSLAKQGIGDELVRTLNGVKLEKVLEMKKRNNISKYMIISSKLSHVWKAIFSVMAITCNKLKGRNKHC